MRVCLASAPTIAEFRDLDLLDEVERRRIPLGVLGLASTLERAGRRSDVVILDALFEDWNARARRRGPFLRHVVDQLVQRDAEVYGLSTICSSYPLVLRIATALKEARPGSLVVLGGPQATATARETLAAFPAVDVIVRGEGDATLPALIDAVEAHRDLASVAGLAHRSRGEIRFTPDAPLVVDLDALPLPAYHLDPRLERGRTLPLEVGRGCPFSCTFCSTSRFFGRRFRMKSPARVVEDMLTLRARYGTRRFDLVHDNFTVDRRRVVAFCEAVSSAHAGLTWTCSSRTDTLDRELVDLMWRSGCRGFFFGIESGSAAMQLGMEKRLDLDGARDLLRHVARRKMTSTVAFITGFPDERRSDLRDTVSFFMDSLRLDFLAPQLSLLSPLAGTPLLERHRHELVHGEVVSDMAFQGQEQDPADRELVRRHPAVFSSFYSIPTRWLDRGELDELRLFLLHAQNELRWLLLAAAAVTGDGLAAFAAFRAWRARRAGRWREQARGAPAAYYRSPAFPADFVRFVRQELARRHPASAPALLDLARHHASLGRAPARARTGPNRRPVRARNVRLTRLSCDGAALVRLLRSGGDLALVPRRPSMLLTRSNGVEHEVLRIGREAAELLALCDGTRDGRAIAREFRRLHRDVGGVPADIAAAFGLADLRRKKLLAS